MLYTELWTAAYKVISDINKILEHLDNWTEKPLQYGDIYRGECLGLRAFLSFDLLRSFGSVHLDKRGIPYVDKYGMGLIPQRDSALSQKQKENNL